MVERTWILMADASRARIFHESGKGLQELMDFFHAEGREHPRLRVSDRAGNRWGSTPGADLREAACERFALHLGKVLERGLEDGLYDRVRLVVPPRFLGLLRRNLDTKVSACVADCLDKDFSALPAWELEERLLTPRGH